MSIADIEYLPLSRSPLVPPMPQLAPDDMGAFRRVLKMGENVIATWSRRAYQDEVVPSSFLGRSTFILNTPDAIRHVLVDNHENYVRTSGALRVLRPMLGQGLLTADGKAWKHQRRTLAPAFTPRAVSGMIPHMVAVIDETVDRLQHDCGVPVDLREIVQLMALDIAGRTMFSFGMARHGATLRGFVFEYGERLASPHLLDLVLPLPWPTLRDVARARFRRRWTSFIGTLIAERRAAGKVGDAPPRDLFDLMDAARDPETGAAFTDAQLADEVATMILAGHETTATTLFWALYLLALDPDNQERLAREAQEAADTDDPDRLPFTRAVLDETLRLYPPAFLIARAAVAADTVAGFAVKRGDTMMIAPWLLHRHESLWQAPNAFMPERFMPGAPPPERFAYLPFGTGPRVCIGAHFALVEATLALARLVGAFKVALIDKTPVTPIGIVTTQPDRSPMFRITPRSTS